MHDTGLSARTAGASSSSAATDAGDDVDESKTRKAHPAFVAAAYARLHSPYHAAASLLLLAVAAAAFLTGRAYPRTDCPPLRLDSRFLSLPDAAAASDFGSLGVPSCRSKTGNTVEWTSKDLLNGLEWTSKDLFNQSTGRLRYWSNVCLHMFSLEFLNQVANSLEKDSVYHLAQKKIPSIHGYTMGLKLEQFIFNAFNYSPSTTLFGVLREEEFAPVKNANGSAYDSPDSSKMMLLRLHSRWVVAAGGFLIHSVPLYMTGVEVSPLSSYAVENLEAICRGRTFHAPSEISF